MFRRPAGLLVLMFGALLAFIVSACGGAGTDGGGNDGDGGSGSGLSGTGNQGNGGNPGTGAGGGSSSSGSGGGGEVCHPTLENGWCKDAPSCECEPTPYIADAPCPTSVGNVCFPGHNQCGCNLPLGEDYVAADAECVGYISGDTWVTVGDPDAKGTIGHEFGENDQLYMGGKLSPYSEFYDHFTVSARKIVWNFANRDQYDFSEGEFGGDCKTITMNHFHAGENEPFETEQAIWLHHPNTGTEGQ